MASDSHRPYYATASNLSLPSSDRNGQSVQATLLKVPPTVRSMASNTSLVCRFLFVYLAFPFSFFLDRMSRHILSQLTGLPRLLHLSQTRCHIHYSFGFYSSLTFVKFSLSPDPSSWGANLSPNYSEPDDYLHNPDPKRDRKNDQGGNIFTFRGFTNLGCLILLVLGIFALL